MAHPHQNTQEDVSVIGVDIGKDVSGGGRNGLPSRRSRR
jgi:hypothetical protein